MAVSSLRALAGSAGRPPSPAARCSTKLLVAGPCFCATAFSHQVMAAALSAGTPSPLHSARARKFLALAQPATAAWRRYGTATAGIAGPPVPCSPICPDKALGPVQTAHRDDA